MHYTHSVSHRSNTSETTVHATDAALTIFSVLYACGANSQALTDLKDGADLLLRKARGIGDGVLLYRQLVSEGTHVQNEPTGIPRAE